ncbi:hypothetical protein [Cryobacterium sp. M15]|jgi:hypothetical protein|uniref:hypothetical protein n=1 Tax=Cryobacterium sp. M15 TaxID=2048291 RepID=UPI000CE2E68F|nr:hypothetical protein [Cryobacterium sp. M15]
MGDLTFAPGESNIYTAKFSPSVVLFWLKTDLAVTNKRIVTKTPNTLFGLIPLGYSDAAYPLANTAGVGVEVKFSAGRAVWGIILLLISFAGLGDVWGWFLLLFAAVLLVNALSSTLKIQNNGGGTTPLKVSILEKAKLLQFRDEINARLFADHDGIRHTEAMDMQTKNLLNQQAQLNLQEQLNQSLAPNQGAQTPPTA